MKIQEECNYNTSFLFKQDVERKGTSNINGVYKPRTQLSFLRLFKKQSEEKEKKTKHFEALVLITGLDR